MLDTMDHRDAFSPFLSWHGCYTLYYNCNGHMKELAASVVVLRRLFPDKWGLICIRGVGFCMSDVIVTIMNKLL